jgi:hypothetical protein
MHSRNIGRWFQTNWSNTMPYRYTGTRVHTYALMLFVGMQLV